MIFFPALLVERHKTIGIFLELERISGKSLKWCLFYLFMVSLTKNKCIF